MEVIFKQAKEEQKKADQAFEEEQSKEEASNPKRLDVVSKNLTQKNASKKTGGRGRKKGKGTIEEKTISIKLGSAVQVMNGAFAGFSGTLKKFDIKTGLVYLLLCFFIMS